MIQEHEIVLYQVEGTNICVNVVFKDETFWMTQKAMAELFDVNVPAISKHLSNIFEEGELFKEATVSKMEIVISTYAVRKQSIYKTKTLGFFTSLMVGGLLPRVR